MNTDEHGFFGPDASRRPEERKTVLTPDAEGVRVRNPVREQDWVDPGPFTEA